MKNLGLWNKFVFLLNSFFALALLVSYALPYFPPKIFPPVSALTLVIPVLLTINVLFAGYWLLLFKRQFLLSALILCLWFFMGNTLYKFGSGTVLNSVEKEKRDLGIFSYNVHVLRSEEFSKEQISDGLLSLIKSYNPDILTFQEFSKYGAPEFEEFPFTYFGDNEKFQNNGQAIYSKYEIVNKGSLHFESTFNNAIFADIVKDQDTIRIYNVHMQSLALTPELGALEKENPKSLVGRLGRSFAKQQEQTNKFLAHQRECSYKKIVSGDFNNTAFSFTYNKIRGTKRDAFEEKGSGFGRTFIFDVIPLRIDFILPDNEIQVKAFQNFDVNYSDHFPIMALLSI